MAGRSRRILQIAETQPIIPQRGREPTEQGRRRPCDQPAGPGSWQRPDGGGCREAGV